MACKGNSGYTWSSLKPMPTKRVFTAAVGVGSELYVIGGCDAKGVPLDAFESINVNKKKWNRLRNLPVGRAGVCAVTMDKTIFTFGGVQEGQVPTSCAEMYNTETKQLTEIDPMREKLMGVSSVVKDNKVFVIGGMGEDGNAKDYVMFYIPEINKWGQITHGLPTNRYATYSFVIDQCIYVLGGRQGKEAISSVESFDPREGIWKKLQDIPSKRVFALYAASEDTIYSVGGLNADAKKGFSDVVELYDIRADAWGLGSPCPTKRGDFALGYQDGKLIAAGGLGNEGKPMAAVDSYDVMSDQWTQLPPMPNSHCSCAYTMHKGQLYVAGGLTVGGPSANVEVLSTTSQSASSKS